MKRIGFIGGGAMAEAIIKGLIDDGWNPAALCVSDISEKRLEYLKEALGVGVTNNNLDVTGKSDVIIFAVKPQNMKEAVSSIADSYTSEKLLISIMAGVSTSSIETLIAKECKVIRVMPNTPALIGEGTSVLAAGSGVNNEDMELARNIFSAVGKVNVLPEKLLNAVTGLSGSGPAYVYLFIEALADGGVLAGLPRDVALDLAVGTVIGAARMVEENKKHPAQLKDMVTSPAGTTIYGILEMEKHGMRGTVMETVLRAAKRAEEL